MRALLRKLRRARFRYQPLIEVRIDRSALEHNYVQHCRSFGSAGVAPVLKSNAYGHDLCSVATVLDPLRPPFLVIDSYFEAMMLQNERIRSPLLIMGYTPLINISRFGLADVRYVLMGMEQVREVAAHLKSPRVFHLKVDTGMHRQGVMVHELDEAIKLLTQNPYVKLEGACTHLADADSSDTLFVEQQIKVWNRIAATLRTRLPTLRYWHVAASAGVRLSDQIDANVARVGLGLYGLSALSPNAMRQKTRRDPNPTSNLAPVLSVTTTITSIRTLRPGQHVGYNGTWTAHRPARIATIPLGYFEGLDRRLSNCGFVQVGGVLCPIVGRISMNIASIDVTQVPVATVGDTVNVYSADPSAANSIAGAARLANTIPYDLLVHIPQHLRRVIV